METFEQKLVNELKTFQKAFKSTLDCQKYEVNVFECLNKRYIEAGEYVCDNCTMPYTQFSQIDYTLCKRCGGIQEDARADEYIRQEQEEKQKLKEKQIRNEKQRKYYYSEKAIEKRRLKKIELQELRARQHEESVKTLSAIFKDMFKYM